MFFTAHGMCQSSPGVVVIDWMSTQHLDIARTVASIFRACDYRFACGQLLVLVQPLRVSSTQDAWTDIFPSIAAMVPQTFAVVNHSHSKCCASKPSSS
ncbi:hypothetical protein BJV74DRAFT_810038 [Russula compacta]|nr:hypothetical protein BJV74DRAFT_810038 [Russula compacta]